MRGQVMANTVKDKQVLEGMKMEYAALKSESLQRIGLRQQLISITLTITGVMLSFGVNNGLIALIYPPLALFLVITWIQNDTRIRDSAKYIREEIEPNFPGLHWEAYIQKDRELSKNTKRQRTILSHGGIFVFTQLIAILVGCFTITFSPMTIALLVIDFISVILVLVNLRFARR
jgi:hypothetical protein